jgi:predicted nucleic acid-binding protein
MTETVFIDSDILFRYFAISEEKLSLFNSSGTIGVHDLDAALFLLKEIEQNEQYLCISEYSILELICTLQRLNCAQKIPNVVSTIFQTFDVMPLNDNNVTLAWFLGSQFPLHSGDAVHAAFCILSDIDIAYISENSFLTTFEDLQQDYFEKGSSKLENFCENIGPPHFAQGLVLKKY